MQRLLAGPHEVVVSTLTEHQRYFPIANKKGNLLARFITVANLESKDPEQVLSGNERVIRPRLADAAFFWDNDRRTPLAGRLDALREVVYQRGLGSLADKSARISAQANRAAPVTRCRHRPTDKSSRWPTGLTRWRAFS